MVSDQQANQFLVYPLEGSSRDIHSHKLITLVSISTDECDGKEATSVNLSEQFSNGMLVAMNNGKVFILR